VLRRKPKQPAIREDQGWAGPGVGEVHSSEEASNDRGAKGPWFKGNVGSNKRKAIGARLGLATLETPRQIQTTFKRLKRRWSWVFTVCESAETLVRKPDADPHVRFDERDLETETWSDIQTPTTERVGNS